MCASPYAPVLEGRILDANFNVNSRTAIGSAILLGTLGVLSFIIQPALVQGFVTEMGISEAEALNLAGIEMLGVAIATIALVLPGVRIDWRRALFWALITAAMGNLMSAALTGTSGLWGARLIAGSGHGAIISLSFSFVGLTRQVDRNIALYLTSLLTYGALGIWALPALLDLFGFAGLFLSFAIILAVGLTTVRFVPRSPDTRTDVPDSARDLPKIQRLVALMGVLSYNLAQGIAWAVVFLVGVNAGIGETTVGGALFVSQVLAIGGALASVFLAHLLARRVAVTLGILGGCACIALLLGKPGPLLFLLGVCGFNVLWNFVLPFILAAVGEFHTSGRMVGNAIAMQMIGLGLGPFVAAWLTDGSDYQVVIYTCIGFFLASFCLLMLPMHAQIGLLRIAKGPSAHAA